MLRRSLGLSQKKALPNTAVSLAKRIQMELSSEGTMQRSVLHGAVRLVYHQAHKDPYLSLLPPRAFIATVNRSLAIISAQVKNKSGVVTMPMMRALLDLDEEPLSKTAKLIAKYSKDGDRNILELASKMTENGLQKQGSFHEQLTKGWSLCADIADPSERVCTIYHLICTNGYRDHAHNYTAAQIADARKKVKSKTERYVRTFRFTSDRERYSRRRLLTDGSLHKLLTDHTSQEELRRVAWILFFDSMYQRFPKRPAKQPAQHMPVLWQEWQATPSVRMMPFLERFAYLMSRPELPELLEQARADGDAKFRANADKTRARFEHRREAGVTVDRAVYDTRTVMAKKKLSLSQLAYQLQYERMGSPELSAEPVYSAVLKTSKAYRPPAAAAILAKAQADTDKSFAYAGHDL